MVEVVSQILRASIASMAIIDPKERTFGPVLVLTMVRFHDVEDDGDSIFVIVSYKTLVGVGGVGPYYSISFERALGRLVVGNNYSCSGLQRQLLVDILRFVHHLSGIANGQ